jgi:membrane protein
VQGLIRNILQHVRRLLTAPREEFGLLQRSLSFWIRLVVYCGGELKRDKARQVAAALTYHTVFSLVPMLVLALLVLQSVRGLESSVERFEDFVIQMLLPESAVDPVASPLRVPNDLETQREFDEARALVREQFGNYIRRLRELNLTGLGIAGLLVFLYGATSLLGTVERSFDSLYRAETRRSIRIRIPLYFTIMTLGPVLLVGGQVFKDQLLTRVAETAGIAWLAGLLATLAPILCTWVLFFAVFVLVPNTHVKRRAAIGGSLLTTILWMSMQGAFEVYVSSTVITSLYGALAVVPILLLWIFLGWLVVLLGLEVSYSLQFLADRDPAKGDFEAPLSGDPGWLVPILTHIGRGFTDGRSTSRMSLRSDCGLPLSTLASFLNRLESNGWIHQVVGSGGESEYSLAKPPSQIPLREVLAIEPPPHQPGPGWDYLARLSSMRDGTVGDDTLAALLE